MKILNRLAQLLRQTSTNASIQAQARAQLLDTSVDSVFVEISGQFYFGASVEIASPGIVRAAGRAVIDGGTVTGVLIDVRGGVYSDELAQLITAAGFVIVTQLNQPIIIQQSSTAVQFIGGGGSGAIGEAVLVNGSVVSVQILDGGSGYTSPPEVVFTLPRTPLPPARAVANVVRGRVESIIVTDGMHSYLVEPNVRISAPQLQFALGASAVSRRHLYLDDINDFPTICFSGGPAIDYSYIQTRQPIRTMRQLLRGYTYSENSLSDSEALARDIESVVQHFNYFAADLGVINSYVRSIRTDEGLLQPYGVCDVEVEIEYEE